jgi:hypothetical protein
VRRHLLANIAASRIGRPDEVSVGVWDHGWDESHYPLAEPGSLTGRVFVGDEVGLDVSFEVARAGLARLSRGGWLSSASEDAYGLGVAGLSRVGALGLTREVRVQALELAQRDGSAGLAIRWEVTGPGGGLSPVLDADITVHPAGEGGTLLTLAGAYRPPLGALGEALDRAILHRVAAATVRNFLSRVAAEITGRPSPAGTDASSLPGTHGLS